MNRRLLCSIERLEAPKEALELPSRAAPWCPWPLAFATPVLLVLGAEQRREKKRSSLPCLQSQSEPCVPSCALLSVSNLLVTLAIAKAPKDVYSTKLLPFRK